MQTGFCICYPPSICLHMQLCLNVYFVNIWRVCLRALVSQPHSLWLVMRHEHAHLCWEGRRCRCLLTWVGVKLYWDSVRGQTVDNWQDMSLACSFGTQGLIEGFCARTVIWCLSWVRKTPVSRSKIQGRFFQYFCWFKLTAGPATMWCDHILLWPVTLTVTLTCLPAYIAEATSSLARLSCCQMLSDATFG